MVLYILLLFNYTCYVACVICADWIIQHFYADKVPFYISHLDYYFYYVLYLIVALKTTEIVIRKMSRIVNAYSEIFS